MKPKHEHLFLFVGDDTMYLCRLIDYAKENNITVYDNVPIETIGKAIVIHRHKTEVILVAGPSRDDRAKYLMRALKRIIGHPVPYSSSNTGSACHSVSNDAALR